MNMLIAPGEGYIPEYTRTDLTDKLHDVFGMKKNYWALFVFVLIIVLQWIRLGFDGQIRLIFL